jgi:hypothetical protein
VLSDDVGIQALKIALLLDVLKSLVNHLYGLVVATPFR